MVCPCRVGDGAAGMPPAHGEPREEQKELGEGGQPRGRFGGGARQSRRDTLRLMII